MDKLLREKQDLQKRNEILQSTLNAWETHQEQLFAREVVPSGFSVDRYYAFHTCYCRPKRGDADAD